jgi:hypothetical protein
MLVVMGMNRSVGHSFTPVFPRPASLRAKLSTFGFVVYRAGRGTASRLIVRMPQKARGFLSHKPRGVKCRSSADGFARNIAATTPPPYSVPNVAPN